MKGQRVGYARVSSIDQNPIRQLDALAGVDRIFTDKVSGKDTNRPELQNLIAYVRDGDTVVVHSLDRLARNLGDLKKTVLVLTQKGVRIEFIKEGLSFSGDDSPIANLMLSVMGAFAEFERDWIRERQREGIALAKKEGVYTGRKRSLSEIQRPEINKLLAQKVPKTVIAKQFSVSRQTLYQFINSDVKTENPLHPASQ